MIQDGESSTLAMYIIGAGLLLAPGIGATLWQRWYIRTSVNPAPQSVSRLWLWKFLSGLAIGLILVILIILPAFIAGAFNPPSTGWEAFHAEPGEQLDFSAGGLLVLFSFQTGFEELVYRTLGTGLFGILLLWVIRLIGIGCSWGTRQIRPAEWLGAGIAASAVIAVAFAIHHAGNPAVSMLGLVNIALAGMLLGVVAWLDGDIWGAWALHFIWNAAIALFGLPVSGIRVFSQGPFSGAVPGLLSGGQFGPEASLPATAVLTAAIVVLLWRSARQVRRLLRTEHDEAAG